MGFACIDIGGTNTLIGVGNGSFTTVKKVPTDTFLEDVQGHIARVIDAAGYDGVDTMAVAAAGPIDRKDGLFYPPNIDVDAVQLREPLKAFDAEVRLINDCNAAVLGEYKYGEDGTENMVYLTISTGIGAGVIVDGELVEGKDGNFGEIGHIIVDNNGVDCGCGGCDHWEAYCSGDNLPHMAEELFGHEFSDARTLFDAYGRGDTAAAEVVEQMQEYNARGIANVINIFDPEVILLGGGVALNHADILVDGLSERIGQDAVNAVPELKQCSLEERSVLHGLRAVCNGYSRQQRDTFIKEPA